MALAGTLPETVIPVALHGRYLPGMFPFTQPVGFGGILPGTHLGRLAIH